MTAVARDELRDRLTYILEHGTTPRASRAFIDRIHDRCNALCTVPFVGHDHSEISLGLRTVPFRSVVIVFEVTEAVVRVLHIYGAMQNLERLLRRN